MRITSDVTAAGSRWTFSFPKPPKLDTVWRDGEYDREAGRRHLIGCGDCITWADSDDHLVCAVALTFLDLVDQWKDWAANDDASRDRHTLDRLDRRADRDITTKVRVEFRRNRGGVRFRITHANLRDVVEKDEFERYLAQVLADIAMDLRDRFNSTHGEVIQLDPATERMAMELRGARSLAEIEEERRRKNDERMLCDNYRNGYCSPLSPGCPHCLNGRCVEI